MLPSKTIPEVSNKKGHMHVLKPKIKMKPMPAPQGRRQGLALSRLRRLKMKRAPAILLQGMPASLQQAHSKSLTPKRQGLPCVSHIFVTLWFYRRLET
jgi:hypothetical protein